MKGFIVDETYRIEHGKAFVYLFGRLENGESFCTISYMRPHIFIRKDDLARAKKLPATIPYVAEETKLKTMQEEPLVRLVYDIPKDTVPLRKLFEEHKIKCCEADIRFTQRFLMDNGILRAVEIEGSHESGLPWVHRIYKEPKLTPCAWYPKLRVLAFDIETSPDAKRVYSISLACRDSGSERNEVLIVTDRDDLKHARAFADEKSMLEQFRREIISCDPDIITGWNAIDFDLSVLRERFKEHNIPFRMARQDWDCQLRIESSFFKDSTAEFPGRQMLDGIALLKLNFISLDNYKLATAARVLLGEKKLIEGQNKGHDIERAYRKDQQKLVDYNLKDSTLVLDILDKTNSIDIMLNRTLLTGMSLERVRGSIASFDSLYLRELRARGYVAPSAAFAEKEEGISGGYVKQSVPGIYDWVVVCDFKSLYPSIMRTFNIDPLAFERGKDAKDPTNKHKWIVAPNGVVFDAREGILPELLQRLWDARDQAKKRKDQRASFAIKILMNSFFGVLASPVCRFFSMDMGNAITGFARHIIQLSIQKIEEMGYKVIYGDTDSCFIHLPGANAQEAERQGKQIARKITQFHKEYIAKEYHRESYMELELDKVFIRFIMPRVRGSEEGAKKRYAGIALQGDKKELIVVGMEFVRRDWTNLAKAFQEKMLTMVFAHENPEQFIRSFAKDLRAGKHDDLLIYHKAVRKELEGYTKTTPPHVKAARILEEHGKKLSSNIIEYAMTDKGPWPLDLMKEEGAPKLDYDHYVDKQLRPIADAILCFYDTSFDDVVKGSKQTKLGGY
jgi:DNA polymerase-2